MNYFKLTHSIKPQEIGCYPQSIKMAPGYNIEQEGSVYKVNFLTELPENIRLKYFELDKKAKATDLVSAVTLGWGLIISDRAWSVISEFRLGNSYQLLPLGFKRNEEYWNYNLYHNYSSNVEFLDFQNMEFYDTNQVGADPKSISINSIEDYMNYKTKIGREVNPKALKLIKPGLDLFSLKTVFALGYYASERLVVKIKEAGLTGFSFKPVEELIFLR
ncbi:MAG: hypothetical protein VYB44_03755 [Bacteroidota bacterium]|nr:hypothetical protein [Bacteroidota bacterium]